MNSNDDQASRHTETDTTPRERSGGRNGSMWLHSNDEESE